MAGPSRPIRGWAASVKKKRRAEVCARRAASGALRALGRIFFLVRLSRRALLRSSTAWCHAGPTLAFTWTTPGRESCGLAVDPRARRVLLASQAAGAGGCVARRAWSSAQLSSAQLSSAQLRSAQLSSAQVSSAQLLSSASQHLSISASRQLDSSTARQLDSSTARQLDSSTARQLDRRRFARATTRWRCAITRGSSPYLSRSCPKGAQS